MWPSIIAGGASLLGSIFSSDTSAKNTQAQIQASQQQQATQNEFSERMSNTAYQRASSDMQKAGLNPMMMFGSGSAASSPSGSSIQAPMPQNTSPMAGLGPAVTKAMDAAVTAKTLDKTSEEIANLKVENAKLMADVDLSRVHGSLGTQQIKNLEIERQTKELGLPAAQVGEKSAKDVLSMPDDIRKGINQGKYQDSHVGGAVGGFVGAIRHSAKKAGEYFSGGSSFSDRFDAAYGNSK